MKFNFKIQQYQTDAVESVVRVFNGQGHYERVSYIRDLGKVEPKKPTQTYIGREFASPVEQAEFNFIDDTGFKNEVDRKSTRLNSSHT